MGQSETDTKDWEITSLRVPGPGEAELDGPLTELLDQLPTNDSRELPLAVDCASQSVDEVRAEIERAGGQVRRVVEMREVRSLQTFLPASKVRWLRDNVGAIFAIGLAQRFRTRTARRTA